MARARCRRTYYVIGYIPATSHTCDGCVDSSAFSHVEKPMIAFYLDRVKTGVHPSNTA